VRTFARESEFTAWVLKEARSRGWKAAHLETYRVVRKPSGPIAIPSKEATGFPDCVFAHPTLGFFLAELKMPRDRVGRRKLSEAQVAWIIALRACGLLVFVWYPDDEAEIVSVLQGRPIAGRLAVEEPIS
jgi:hypothetical protein